jgi:hypothetical protein
MTHPPGTRRRGGGRLGRALKAAASKPHATVGKEQPPAKALARWENEGGRSAPRATSDHVNKVEAMVASKKSVAKGRPKKAKAKPRTSVAKGRR